VSGALVDLAAAQTGIVLEPVVSGLANPVAIAHARDGSGRLFFVLQGGRIVVHDGTRLLTAPFLDISALVASGGERGLLGLAFHPGYRTNGFFYVNYTNTAGDTVIARYTVSADPNVANPGSASLLLTIPQPFANHNGGQLEFGPDGYLYIATGDGGSGGDPGNRAQNLGDLLGKILRIDVDGGAPYIVPATNPFVGVPGARGEIWAYGLRNPWRFSFDRLTGDVFIADVGQSSREEVNFQPALSPGGENYGWRRMEGTTCFNPASGCNDGSLTLPIIEYDHVLGCSVTGGYRYRGTRYPLLHGTYFYGDFCAGRIWGAAQGADGRWTSQELLDSSLLISTFGQDEAGDIYVAHHGGDVYRITTRTAMAPETFVTGFYTIALGRAPAAAEVAAWVGALAANRGVAGAWALARGVFGSPEFLARALTPASRVTALYQTILGRTPSAGEQDVWVPLIVGAFDTLVPPFVASPEFRGALTTTSPSALVTRLYEQALGRAPGSAELAAWVGVVSGTGDWLAVTRGILGSTEYLSAPRSPAQHVAVLYRSLLGRDPGTEESAGWVAFLAAQLESITGLFIASPEFQARGSF
jgi:glucose/arabinose dehydrogenase